MKLKPSTILFITSFIPVIAFKVLARVGEGTVAQARVATVLGLVLAAMQCALSKRFLKSTTYLEKAFLGFLGVGTAWVHLAPVGASSLFVDHSTALLYFVLFLTALVPQLFGYDPFTYAIAKRWYPETVWNTPQFRTINLHLTYVWSCIFFISFLSSLFGHGRPFFFIIMPLIFILGIGLPLARMYPPYYLKRELSPHPVDPFGFPETAKELISRMPLGFDPVTGRDLEVEIQFDLSGEGGGKMVLSISEGRCTFREGEALSPTLTIRSPADIWMKIARGEIDRPKALMDGLYQVEGDMNLLIKMGELFRAPTKVRKEDLAEKKEGKAMKTLAIQGTPRPKASNTDILLQEFLKGARSQGAETETIYLKEKEIHSCTGCYTCWAKTPGACIFKDDMPELLEKVRACDILVLATPLYNWNMTSLLKGFLERLLPLYDPHLVKMGETYHKPQRYEMNLRMVLVSTCGLPEISHFDGLRGIFRQIERFGHVPLIGELLMPAGELFKQEGLREKVQGVLQAAYRAGVEVIRDGRVSEETEAQIQKPVISADEIAEMANLWWDSHLEGIAQREIQEAGGVEDIRLLLRGMAVTFNARAAGDLKATIQFEVAGKQPGNWFLSIEGGTCTFHEGKVDSPALAIKTPSEIWLAIANGELDGRQAFMEGKYAAQGDMGLLMRMNDLFGRGE